VSPTVGVDLGGTHTRAVAFDDELAPVGRAEAPTGAEEGVDAVVTVGTGVWGGEVLDGRIYRGATGGTGQIGHVVVDPGGPPCGCGGRGCVEVYASGAGIVARAREANVPGEPTTAAVFAAAAGGDAAAASVIDAGADALGVALASYVNLNNPEAIVLGGGVADASPSYRARVELAMRERAVPGLAEVVSVVPGALGDDAGTIGGALLLSEDDGSSA
jgi:glucokinase